MCTLSLLRSSKVVFAIRSINSNIGSLGKFQANVNKLCLYNLSTKPDLKEYKVEIPEPSQLDPFKDTVKGPIKVVLQQKIPDATKHDHAQQAVAVAVEVEEEDTLNQMDEDTAPPPPGTYALPHPVWTEEELHGVKITKREPQGRIDKLAYLTVKLFRTAFDITSGFNRGQRTETKWLNRICFLETVAGVPGMVAAMARHMKSLRLLRRDYGWIHTLLEEAENERMHLLTAMEMKQPSLMFRLAVITCQGVFVTMFTGAYVFSPTFCHRFVGYLEEEAVKTYSKCLEDMEDGPMSHWKTLPATDLALRYWKLPDDATMRDVVLAIRADEAHHRVVNHTLASMKGDEFNPYKPGK